MERVYEYSSFLVCMKIVLTIHLKEQLGIRNIFEEEVIEAIRFPLFVTKKHGKYFYKKKLHRGTIEACCEVIENNIKVITVYWV